MARDVLSHEDMQKLLTEFERVEKKDIGEGVHEKYIELVERLWKKYVSKQS
jgi:hemerythrin-like domain-containing protein